MAILCVRTNMDAELKTEVYPRSLYIVSICHQQIQIIYHFHISMLIWFFMFGFHFEVKTLVPHIFVLSHHFVIFPDLAMMFPLFSYGSISFRELDFLVFTLHADSVGRW